ncbi:MAG: hypothetical protein ABR923_07190 [Terracidiphilus sp.]
MGASFVGYKEFGYRTRDGFLADWIGALMNEIERKPEFALWQEDLVREWEVQRLIDGGCMWLGLDESSSTIRGGKRCFSRQAQHCFTARTRPIEPANYSSPSYPGSYSIFGIGVDRKHTLKWLFLQEKATFHGTEKVYMYSENARKTTESGPIDYL